WREGEERETREAKKAGQASRGRRREREREKEQKASRSILPEEAGMLDAIAKQQTAAERRPHLRVQRPGSHVLNWSALCKRAGRGKKIKPGDYWCDITSTL
ncbi:hypothetical protein L3Q82_008443, partial [Scortum barcoo]